MSQSSKFGAMAILVVIFSIGAFSGVGGTFYYLKQKNDHRGPRPERIIEDVYNVQIDRMTSRLERSLELSEMQIPLVRAEIENFASAMREKHEEMKPQLDSLMQERAIAIEKHLSAEQQEAFQNQRIEHRERLNKSRRDRKGREGGPRACCHGMGLKKSC
jgi:hypothetical protein|tara:strand:+ start:1286 stop:1765 length:480 start_codon:yes stop_codon:yes gene_type:complete